LRLEPFGIAIPLVILTTSLFRSYFSGGSNDNRAWQPYSLGPDAVEQKMILTKQMKIAFSSEFRFKILGELKGALLLMQVISGMFTTT
jgi:hypothetical protein